MCNSACIDFIEAHLSEEEVRGRETLEVGSLSVNGSVRESVVKMMPLNYVGVDISAGPGVDLLCDAHDLVSRFGENRFDIVISTELIEHTRDWRSAVSNMKRVLRPNGVLLITTRSKGFGYHGYPFDFWRYELRDLESIFSDMDISALEPDPLQQGVFLKARKPPDFCGNDLLQFELFSVVRNRRCRDVSGLDIILFKAELKVRRALSRVLPGQMKAFLKKLVRYSRV